MEQESAAERVVQMVPWKEARIVAGWNRIRTLRGIADQNKSPSRVLGGTSLSAKPGGRLPQGRVTRVLRSPFPPRAIKSFIFWGMREVYENPPFAEVRI